MKRYSLLLVILLAGCQDDTPPPVVQAPIQVKTACKLPGDACQYIAQLGKEIDDFWPALAKRTFPAGLIEQESLWKLKAKLQTSRELGVGLGQFTKAYNADGSVRFDALEETKHLDKSLAGWSWQDPYNAEYQLRAVVLKLKVNDRTCATQLTGADEILACDAAKYNGGAGSITKRIRLCQVTAGCDSHKWFGNLELMVAQSTAKVAGYGESFAETNSRYPARVFARMLKYQGHI